LAAKRLTRKEIVHKDPIQIALENTSSWIVRNRVLLVSGLVIICLAILAVYGWNNYSSSRGDEMQIAVAEGLERYHGKVKHAEEEGSGEAGEEGSEAPEDLPEPSYTFSSDSERLEKSLASFEKTAEEFEGTRIGDLALFYTALCHIDMGNAEQAAPILQGLIGNSDYKDVRNLARNSASQLAAENNETERAIALLEEIVEDPSDNYPVQFTLMNIAMLYEAVGNTDQAIKAYQRVATEYAETSSAAEAGRKLSSLDPKGEKSSSIIDENSSEEMLPVAE